VDSAASAQGVKEASTTGPGHGVGVGCLASVGCSCSLLLHEPRWRRNGSSPIGRVRRRLRTEVRSTVLLRRFVVRTVVRRPFHSNFVLTHRTARQKPRNLLWLKARPKAGAAPRSTPSCSGI
jgi:hypothetical protein